MREHKWRRKWGPGDPADHPQHLKAVSRGHCTPRTPRSHTCREAALTANKRSASPFAHRYRQGEMRQEREQLVTVPAPRRHFGAVVAARPRVRESLVVGHTLEVVIGASGGDNNTLWT